MFDSLDDKMKLDDTVECTRKERYVKYSAIAVMSMIVFAALYAGLMMIGG
jgi:hypothetical protein